MSEEKLLWVPFEPHYNEEAPEIGSVIKIPVRMTNTSAAQLVIAKTQKHSCGWLVGLDLGKTTFDDLYDINEGWFVPRVVKTEQSYYLTWELL